MTKRLADCTPAERERVRAATRAQQERYSATARGAAIRAAGTARYVERHREKDRAGKKARRALAAGRITRQGCEVCGELAEMHHDDYTRPLEVRWLCRPHHVAEHRARA